jgi:hypothetical protein
MKHNDVSLSEKGFLPPVGTALKLYLKGNPDPLQGVLVGIIPDKYLIVMGQFRAAAGTALEGRKTTVQFVREDTVYEFDSELSGVSCHPEEIAFITCPEKVEPIERRRQKRFACFLPAASVIGEEKHQGVIQEISERGCTFVIKASPGVKVPPMKISDPLTLSFQWPGMKKEEAIVGEVRSIQFSIEFYKNEMRLGVKKRKDASGVLKRIAEYFGTFEPH